MSKSLEKEYKEYIQMETPDLWSRIEKELSENGQRTEIQPKVIGKELASKTAKKDRKRNIRRWMTVGSLAAAALVVVVTIPFANSGLKSAESSSDMYVADVAGSTITEEKVAEDEVNMEMAEAMVGMTDTTEGTASNAEILVETVEVTVAGILVTEKGEILYTGVTESGEYYTFKIAEGIMPLEEKGEINGLIEGNSYSVDLVKEEEIYRAVAVYEKK